MDVRATIATDDRAVYRTDHDASVNLYLIMDEYAEQNEQKKTDHYYLIVRSAKSDAEVTNNKRRCSRYRTAEAN